MRKTIKILMLGVISLFLFSSCSKRRIIISAPEVKRTQINTWAQQTNEKEDVDISDLENKESVSPISRTIINEGESTKMERVPFSVDEYRHLARTGNATIKGAIYLHNAYNQKIPGSNTRLYLNPVTSYSNQWYQESYLGGHKMTKADSRLFNYLRFTSADEQGNFAFYGVPSGDYYLIGTVKCVAQCGYSSAKNIRIATRISIRGKQIVNKDLTKLIE